ncbi:MAG: 7-carboxy-7-deazaguanine synthase QueE [Alphaproteobacteria bacterium]|nr:7-carboxy-7-deazaguanine synthase QueE [Alphaproteobacteria bacterium]
MEEDTRIRISEIFGPTVQGEGALIGEPTVFVRTGGCDYRCSWCDTLHAVESRFRHDWIPHSAEEVMEKVAELSGNVPVMVSLSGGNPASQPLGALMQMGHDRGYRFALETQGSVAKDWFADLDVLTLSPKPPSSGMETDWSKFDECLVKAGFDNGIASEDGPEIALKIVIFDDVDYQYAQDAAKRYPNLPLYIQPGNHTPPKAEEEDGAIDIGGIIDRYDWLVAKVSEDRWFNIRVLPQLHVLIWGNKRGV